MPKSPRRRFPAMLVLLGAVAIAAIWLLWPRDGLLDRSVLLVPRDRWLGLERGNGELGNYLWLSKEEVLLFKRNPNQTVTLLRKRVLPPGNTEAATPLPIAPLVKAGAARISPDRKTVCIHLKVLLNYKSAGRFGVTSEFLSLGDGRKVGAVSGYALGEWYEGSPSLCELGFDKKLTAAIHHYDTGKDEEVDIPGVIDAPLMRGNVWPLFIEANGRTVAIGDSYYDGIVTPASKANFGSKISAFRTLIEFNLETPNAAGRVWTIPVPADAASFFCEVAPTHDRLLWTVQSNRMPFLNAISQKLPPPFKRPSCYLCRWMVSDLEGRKMHTLAEFDISSLYYNRPDLLTPQWTPDGKNLSFEYKGALYLLPVD